VRIVNGVPQGGWTSQWEIVCPACGDDVNLDYVTVSPYLQRVRGPYPNEAAGLAALRQHRGQATRQPTAASPAHLTSADVASADVASAALASTDVASTDVASTDVEKTVPNRVPQPTTCAVVSTEAGASGPSAPVSQEQDDQAAPEPVGSAASAGTGTGAGVADSAAGERF
jgi:hypothetical protein